LDRSAGGGGGGGRNSDVRHIWPTCSLYDLCKLWRGGYIVYFNHSKWNEITEADLFYPSSLTEEVINGNGIEESKRKDRKVVFLSIVLGR
jgi:hypothetical protein